MLRQAVPVGSIVMPDDYAFVLATPVTFWDRLPMGTFSPEGEQEGKIHFAPASGDDTEWVLFRAWVQKVLYPVLGLQAQKIKLAEGQKENQVWPCVVNAEVDVTPKLAYVQTCGPRFETRSEIQVYKQLGHIVGMTCSSEWTLAQELCLPYVLVCAVDNSANGLSLHPGGPVQEYLDHKGSIAEVTTALIDSLSTALSKGGPSAAW
jgi:5'-methylthioadenosine phosphorylase